MSDRDLSPFFAPKSIAVVGAGERATSSGGAIMQMLRQAGYGGRVVPVNPKGGTIFGYESVTSIAAIDPPVDLTVIVIRPDAILDSRRALHGRCIAGDRPSGDPRSRLADAAAAQLPGKTEWFAIMEGAGVPMFNDVEEMAEAAGLLARYPRLCERARSDNLSDVRFRDRRGA